MPNLRRVGKEAEDQAADYLLNLGYTIVTRRFSSKHGEIDIIALDPQPNADILVFVEVKSRSKANLNPENAVNWTKQKHFHNAAAEYFTKTDFPTLPARYDVITIDPSGLKHFIDAFRPEI